MKKYNMSNMGLLKHLLVIKITQTKDRGLTFQKYMLRKFLKNMLVVGPCVPLVVNEKLMKKYVGCKYLF